MRFIGWKRPGVAAAAGLAVAAAAASGLPAASAASTASAKSVSGPVIRLEAAQRSVTVRSTKGSVHMDPGIWLSSLGSALQFDVQRASYTKPVTLMQVIHTRPGSAEKRPLPATLLDGWNGLKHFIQMTVRNATGTVVASPWLTFCPNTRDPQRASLDSPAAEPYPSECSSQDPFTLSEVWGIAKGWATDPAESAPGLGTYMHLPAGKYQVTATVAPAYVRLLHIASGYAAATVEVTVVKGSQGSQRTVARPAQTARSLSAAPDVPYLANPPKSALPDLVPHPAWGISTTHTSSGQDMLDFAATVWIGGNGPLDVQGFRVQGSPVMKAYQYFWRNGRVIGRVRAGTMSYDNQMGHHHWHFEQFARYALLDSAKHLAVRSHKVGFCIAPTDPVDLVLPHAVWQPQTQGLTGQCGAPTALWTREMLPLGWGDTYVQNIAGQAFNITKLPNGTYYIEVAVNPLRLLHETTTSNDVTLRKVILGGTPGHRTVTVPPWHGISG